MNYELAKQLEETGFPFKGNTWAESVYPPGVEKLPGEYLGAGLTTIPQQGQVRVPTLSELIEACGEDMQTLWQYQGVWFAAMWGGEYMSPDVVDASFPISKGEGPTPEEAVANLWLALNKK